MDLPPCTVKQEKIECEKSGEEEFVLEDEIHLTSYQSDPLKLVRITCHGNLHEPSFPRRLQRITSRLKFLLSNGKEPLKVAKVEPWNSVRVTFNLSQDAAQRLQQLAEHGEHLRELGILSVQIEGQQVISLRIPNQNNIANGTNTVDSGTCHNSVNIAQNSDKITNKEENEVSLKELKQPCESSQSLSIIAGSGNKYLYEQLNGAIGGEENSNSSHSSSIDHLPHQSSVESQAKVHSYHVSGTNTAAVGQQLTCQVLAPSRPASEPLSTTANSNQVQRVAIPTQFHVSQVQSRTNSLLVPSSQANADYQSPQQPNSYMSSATTVNTSSQQNAMASDPSLFLAKSELSRVNATPAVMVSQACVQSSQSCPSSQSNSVAPSVTLQSSQQQSQLPPLSQQHLQAQQLSNNATINIRNNSPASQFSKQIVSIVPPKPPQSTPQVFVSSQNSVPIVSSLQSQHYHSVKTPNSLSIVTSSQTPSSSSSVPDSPFGPNGSSANIFSSSGTFTGNNVLYQTSKPTISSAEPITSAGQIEDTNLNKTSESGDAKLERSNQTPTVLDLNASDILGSSVDAVDEDLLDSVAATGADSLDLPNFADLSDLNVLNMLEEIESAPQSHVSQSSTASQDTIQCNINTANDVSQVGECVASSVPASKSEEKFSSPNVVAPQSTQPLPFLIAQPVHQSSSKVSTSIATGQLLINSSTGTIVGKTSIPKSHQALVSSSSTSQPISTTIYPFTSMQHASMFNAKQSSNQASPRHVFLPVRQLPTVRTSSTPSTSVSIARTLSSSTTPASDLLIQQAQQTLYRTTGNQHVQSVQSPNPNATSLPGTPQPSPTIPTQQPQATQQILAIRQASNFNSSTPAQTSNTSSGQTNPVALSSPLLVNLLQSEVQPNVSLQQTHQQNMPQSQPTAQFISTAGGQPIRLINQSGAHVEGSSLIMVRVSTAQNGTTQWLHPGTGSVIATVNANSQVATSVASQVVEPQQQQQQANTSSTEISVPIPQPKPKRVRKPRKPKNQPEVINQDNPQPTTSSMSQTMIQTNKNQSGIISSIPLSTPTPSRVQTTSPASVTTILTIPTSSSTQTLKFHTSQVQSLVQSQMSGQQVFNQQKQRGAPVMVIATSNSNLISSVSNAVETSTTPSSSSLTVSSAGTFFVMGTTSSSVNVSSSTTPSALLSTSTQSGNRQKIILATKSNSFPVSNALSRISTNPSASSTPASLITSPVKFVTQSPSNSLSLPNSSIANSPSDTKTVSVGASSKSSLATMVSSNPSISLSPSTSNAANFVQSHISVSGSDLSSINVPMLQTSAGNTFLSTNTSNSISQPKLLSQTQEIQAPRTSQAILQSPSKSPPLQLTTVSAIKTFQVSQQPGVNAGTLLFNKISHPNSIPGPKLITSALAQFPSKGQLCARVPVSQLQVASKQIVAKARAELSANEPQISILSTTDGTYTRKHTPENSNQVESKFSKVDNLDGLLSTHEPKETSGLKSISELNYKMEDILPNDVPTSDLKLDSVITDVDCERSSEVPPTPVSPSYFLACSSPKLETKVTEASSSASQKSESITSNEVNESQVVVKGETIKKEQQNSEVEVLSNTESKAENSTLTSTNISSNTSSVSTDLVDSKTEPESKPTLSKSTDNALKTNKTPYNFYLPKHNLSQDLPDHILEDDDEDDEDSDSGFIMPLCFMSGNKNIGNIGRNVVKSTIGNISSSSSTFGSVLPSLPTLPKPSDSTSDSTDSITENERKSSISNETTSLTNKVNKSEEQASVIISQPTSNALMDNIDHLDLNNERSLSTSHTPSSKTDHCEESTHTLVNGDMVQHTENIVDEPAQSSTLTYHNDQESSHSLLGTVASKSFPSSSSSTITTTESTTKSLIENRVMAQIKPETKKTEVQQNTALSTPTKPTRVRKPSVSSPKTKSTKPVQTLKTPGGANKARNRGKNSIATTLKTNPDPVPTSHSEFQSLLASPSTKDIEVSLGNDSTDQPIFSTVPTTTSVVMASSAALVTQSTSVTVPTQPQSVSQPVVSRITLMHPTVRARTPYTLLLTNNSITSPQLKLMTSPSKTVSASNSQSMYLPVHSSSSGLKLTPAIVSSEHISKIDSNENSEATQLRVVARKSCVPNSSTHTSSLDLSSLLSSQSSSQPTSHSESNADKSIGNLKLTNSDISSIHLSQDLNSSTVSFSSTVARSQSETASTLQTIPLVETLSASKVTETSIHSGHVLSTNCTDQVTAPTSTGYLDQSNSTIVLRTAKSEVVGNSLLLKAREETGIVSKQVATTRVPQTRVQIVVNNDSSTPNLLFLKEGYKFNKEHLINFSTGQVRPKLVINKHSQLAQQLTASTTAEMQGAAIYATKSNQPISATKVLPSILSKSKTKRKNDTSLATISSQQIQTLALGVETSSNFAQPQLIDLESQPSGVYPKATELIQNKPTKLKPQRQQTSSQDTLLGEVHTDLDESATKTRKRARKSKVTTLEQSVSSPLNTSTPMVLNFTDITGGHIEELGMEPTETIKSSNLGNSRVLRKTSPAKSPGGKRGSRNRNVLMANASIPLATNTDSTSTVSMEASKTNEKTRKGRDASKQTSRPTRSRSRKKSNEQPTIRVTNSQIATSSNADAIFSQTMPIVEVPSNEMIVTSGSIHIPVATSALITHNSSQMNPTAGSSTNQDNSRSISLLDNTGSILAKQARTRKTIATSKPSLRSNATQDAEVIPSPSKRRRVAKESNKQST